MRQTHQRCPRRLPFIFTLCCSLRQASTSSLSDSVWVMWVKWRRSSILLLEHCERWIRGWETHSIYWGEKNKDIIFTPDDPQSLIFVQISLLMSPVFRNSLDLFLSNQLRFWKTTAINSMLCKRGPRRHKARNRLFRALLRKTTMARVCVGGHG